MSTLFELDDFTETRRPGCMDCGHMPADIDHYETCLGLVCPMCGLAESSPYMLWANHSPHENGHVDICSVLMWALDHNGCCTSCRGYTFGHDGGCIFEGCDRFEAGHKYDFFADDGGRGCLLCGVPGRMIWKWGVW